ncbi:hypothetical protein PGTDC60_0241 [Porphyromonas gingivalis TDC60]|nr:hypothetical protein PGTDC60_0241 [Porphyromonas gingivalis TDC60]
MSLPLYFVVLIAGFNDKEGAPKDHFDTPPMIDHL